MPTMVQSLPPPEIWWRYKALKIEVGCSKCDVLVDKERHKTTKCALTKRKQKKVYVIPEGHETRTAKLVRPLCCEGKEGSKELLNRVIQAPVFQFGVCSRKSSITCTVKNNVPWDLKEKGVKQR